MKTLLTILLAFPFWNTFQKTATINSMQESAHYAYQTKDYRKAIIQYEELINVYHCSDIRIYHNLGTAYFRILQYKQAEKYFKIIISRNEAPYDSYCYNNMGIIYYRSGQFAKAQEHFKKALSLSPSNEEARYNYEVVSMTILKNRPHMTNQGQEKKTKTNVSAASKSSTGNNSQVLHKAPKSSLQNSPNNQSGGGGNGKGNESTLTTKRLQEMNMNPQNAEHILELLRQRQIQYVHQQKSKDETEQGYPNW